jgi:hypothetical protein
MDQCSIFRTLLLESVCSCPGSLNLIGKNFLTLFRLFSRISRRFHMSPRYPNSRKNKIKKPYKTCIFASAKKPVFFWRNLDFIFFMNKQYSDLDIKTKIKSLASILFFLQFFKVAVRKIEQMFKMG